MLILHIDNNPLELEAVEDILFYDGGHHVVQSETIEKALKWLDEGNNPDIIICDGTIHSPDDGLALARKLIKGDWTVFVYSANDYSNVKDVLKLQKPINKHDLLAMIASLSR